MVSGETRAAALARTGRALTEFAILGIPTNVAFLLALVRHADVRAGRLDTGLLDRVLDQVLAASHGDDLPPEVAAAAVLPGLTDRTGPGATSGAAGPAPSDPWSTLTGWRN